MNSNDIETELPSEVSDLLRRLLPIVLLNTMSIGMMWPAIPEILLDDFNHDSVAVASFLARISALNAVLDFCSNPILGSMSDKYGRKFFLLQSLCVAAVCDFTVAFVGSSSAILVTKVLFGVLDCTKAMCYNVVVDTMDAANTDQAARVKTFGLIGMAVGVGFAFGPLLGGILTMKSPYLATFTAGVFMSISCLYTALKIDETLDTSKSIKRKVCSAEKVQVIVNYRVFVFLVPFLVMGIAMGPYSMWFIYSEARFNWNGWKNGVFWFGHGCAQALSGGLILPTLSPALLSERSVVYLGLSSNALVFFIYAFITTSSSWLLFGIFPIIIMGYLTEPLLRLVFTQLVSPKNQGTLQGALASISTLSNAVGPLIAASLFAWGSSLQGESGAEDFTDCEQIWLGICFNFSSTPFVLSSILFLLAIGLMKFAFRVKDQTEGELIEGVDGGEDDDGVWERVVVGKKQKKFNTKNEYSSLSTDGNNPEFDDFTIEI